MLERDDAGGASGRLVNRSGIERIRCMYASGTMEAAQVVISLIPGIPKIDTPLCEGSTACYSLDIHLENRYSG